MPMFDPMAYLMAGQQQQGMQNAMSGLGASPQGDAFMQALLGQSDAGAMGAHHINNMPFVYSGYTPMPGQQQAPIDPNAIYEDLYGPKPGTETPAAGSNFTIEDVLRMRGMGDAQFAAAGINKGLAGEMMARIPFGPDETTDIAGTNWTGSDQQRALLKSLLNYTPGE